MFLENEDVNLKTYLCNSHRKKTKNSYNLNDYSDVNGV